MTQLEHALQTAAHENYRAMQLSFVASTSKRAVRLFTGAGFEQVGLWRRNQRKQRYYSGWAGWRSSWFVTADWAEVDPADGGALHSVRPENRQRIRSRNRIQGGSLEDTFS